MIDAENTKVCRYQVGDPCPHRESVIVGYDYCFWDCPNFIDRPGDTIVVCDACSEAGDAVRADYCPSCGGTGRAVMSNISGHDYETICSLCGGKGIFPVEEER